VDRVMDQDLWLRDVASIDLSCPPPLSPSDVKILKSQLAAHYIVYWAASWLLVKILKSQLAAQYTM